MCGASELNPRVIFYLDSLDMKFHNSPHFQLYYPRIGRLLVFHRAFYDQSLNFSFDFRRNLHYVVFVTVCVSVRSGNFSFVLRRTARTFITIFVIESLLFIPLVFHNDP